MPRLSPEELWEEEYRYYVARTLKAPIRGSREGETRDLGPTTIHLFNVPNFTLMGVREGSMEFAEAEQFGYLAGRGSDHLLKHAPSYSRFRDANGRWPGAYGPRLNESLVWVTQMLSQTPDTRQAVINIHSHADTLRAGGPMGLDIPCTIALIPYREPSGVLSLHAMMRSTDIWFGLYYDLPAFGFIQARIAEALEWPLGEITLTTTSLHIYRKHEEKATEFYHQSTILGWSNTLSPWLDTKQFPQPGSASMRMWSMQNLAKEKLDAA